MLILKHKIGSIISISFANSKKIMLKVTDFADNKLHLFFQSDEPFNIGHICSKKGLIKTKAGGSIIISTKDNEKIRIVFTKKTNAQFSIGYEAKLNIRILDLSPK